MAQTHSAGMSGLVAKRDKAYDQLAFNREYPAVVAALIDERHEKARRKLELEQKRRLYPLEIVATPTGEANRVQREAALKDFEEKQRLPRLAAEQAAQRLEKKKGGPAARQYREDKIGRLDAKLSSFKAEILAKWPDTDAPAGKAEVDAYAAAQSGAGAEMAAFEKQCAAEKKQELDKLNARLAGQNQKLEQTFNETNGQLQRMGKAGADGKMADELILSLKGIKMYFAGIKAVDDLSFDIRKGEIFGLIGPNGAGKSTLFNCITQFYKPTAGDVYYRDRFDNVINLVQYHSHDVVKTGITRTFQNLELVLGLSVLDNLLVGAHVYYRSNLFDQFVHTKRLKDEEKVNRANAMHILERLNLLPYKNMTPKGLPYGVLKKIELARTLMTKPRLIILDEPAAGLNDAETEELAEIIRRIRDDYSCTIFLVEHDMNLVMSVCDTVCAISFGKMLGIGSPKEIQANPLVQEAYLGAADEGGAE